MTARNQRFALAAILGCGMLSLGACQRAAPAQDAATSASAPAGDGVTLTAEQVVKAGLASTPAEAADYAARSDGYGAVVPHDAIAVAVAELRTTQAAAEQSRAVDARAQRLAGTAGAFSADTVESATRQVTTDDAAFALAQQRLSSVIGAGLPEALMRGPLLRDLASGRIKLLRATFPLGTPMLQTPVSLRAARLDDATPHAAHGWTVRPVWSAPADASLPGRSFFALLKDGDAAEGERLLVWAPGAGPSQRGAVVPASAVVLSSSKYWCYVEARPRVYVRKEVATDRPLDDGYFVTQGIAAGDRIVTSGAGLLLAAELNPGAGAD